MAREESLDTELTLGLREEWLSLGSMVTVKH